ncbi:MAG TPA: hypothetical protein VJC39_03430 [Candidatus Nanoarchaeia archaeon]|nr:hypothetical protein [Candidatus Nanoarchaeia archaeon]
MVSNYQYYIKRIFSFQQAIIGKRSLKNKKVILALLIDEIKKIRKSYRKGKSLLNELNKTRRLNIVQSAKT